MTVYLRSHWARWMELNRKWRARNLLLLLTRVFTHAPTAAVNVSRERGREREPIIRRTTQVTPKCYYGGRKNHGWAWSLQCQIVLGIRICHANKSKKTVDLLMTSKHTRVGLGICDWLTSQWPIKTFQINWPFKCLLKSQCFWGKTPFCCNYFCNFCAFGEIRCCYLFI